MGFSPILPTGQRSTNSVLSLEDSAPCNAMRWTRWPVVGKPKLHWSPNMCVAWCKRHRGKTLQLFCSNDGYTPDRKSRLYTCTSLEVLNRARKLTTGVANDSNRAHTRHWCLTHSSKLFQCPRHDHYVDAPCRWRLAKETASYVL